MAKVLRKLTLDDFVEAPQAMVFAMVCDAPVHRLCFALNETLNLRLSRCKSDHEHWHRRRAYFFAKFEGLHPASNQTWHLTSNKNPLPENVLADSPLFLEHSASLSTILVKDFKKVDYFFWSFDALDSETPASFFMGLKTLREVRTFQKIKAEELSKLDNLLSPL